MAIDFHDFHLIELPRRMQAAAGLTAARLARELAPLCVRVSHTDNAYTYMPQPNTIAVVAGTEAPQQLLLGEEQWQQLHTDSQALAAVINAMNSDEELEPEFLLRWQAVIAVMYYAAQ